MTARRRAAIAVIIVLLIGYFGHEQLTDSAPTKSTQHVKKARPTVKVKPNGVLKLHPSTDTARSVKGYLYRQGNDYLVINAQRGFFKNAQAFHDYVNLNNSQTINLYFSEPNALALAQGQAKNQKERFKLAYGTVNYEALPETDTADIRIATINWQNIQHLPKIRINQVKYTIITAR